MKAKILHRNTVEDLVVKEQSEMFKILLEHKINGTI